MLSPGSSVGPYRIIEPLGRGGMASVYRAYEAKLDRQVALKILRPEFLHDPTFSARFRREATVMAGLAHRSIVPLHAFGIDDGIPWMALRLIPGGTLATVIKQGPLSPARLAQILSPVAEALEYAHSNGVLHRDVKPQNILLDDAGHAYLSDFGIARMVEQSAVLTRSGVVTGTPQYMSPEQAMARGVDHHTDIYALGIVTYEALTGRAPFTADTPIAVLMKHVNEPIPIPRPEVVPEAVFRPVLKCLAKNPSDRWSSATAFTSTFSDAAQGYAAAPGSPTAAFPPTRATNGAPAIAYPVSQIQAPAAYLAASQAVPSLKAPFTETPATARLHPGIPAFVAGGIFLFGAILYFALRSTQSPSPAAYLLSGPDKPRAAEMATAQNTTVSPETYRNLTADNTTTSAALPSTAPNAVVNTALNVVLPNSLVIERISPPDGLRVDIDALIASGADRVTDFAVYHKSARDMDDVRFEFNVQGDAFPSDAELTFAWRADGTAFIGASGSDTAVLATVVDGWARNSLFDDFAGCFLESKAYLSELKLLLSRGQASGASAPDSPESLARLKRTIYNRFPKPLFRIGAAVYLQGIPAPSVPRMMEWWCPHDSWATGYGTRGFRLTTSGAIAGFAVAVANCDNSNRSSILFDGRTIVERSRCCETYWRRALTTVPTEVELSTTTTWSQGAPMVNIAVVADDVRLSGVRQHPEGGLSNNRPPVFTRIPPLARTGP